MAGRIGNSLIQEILDSTVGKDPQLPAERPFVMARWLATGMSISEVSKRFQTTTAWVKWYINNQTPWTIYAIAASIRVDSEKLEYCDKGRQKIARQSKASKNGNRHRLTVAKSEQGAERPQTRGQEIATGIAEVPNALHDILDDPVELEGLDRYLQAIMASTKGMYGKADIMVRAYAAGKSLQEIGEAYNLTRERVRQIINGSSPWTTRDIQAARRDSLQMSKRRLSQRALAWSVENPGISIAEGAKVLGWSEEVLRQRLGARRIWHELPQPNKTNVSSSRRRSNPDILDDIRKYHSETGMTSASGFKSWALETGAVGPQTVSKRFGSWSAAVTAAGISEVTAISRSRRFQEQDLWAAMVEAIRECGASSKSIEARLSATRGAPSLALVRLHIDLAWQEIVEECLKIIAGRSERDPEWLASVTTPRDWESFISDDDPLETVRKAVRVLGPDMTVRAYSRWASEEQQPAALTVMKRSGMSWSELLRAAGGKGREPRIRRTDEEKLRLVRSFLDDIPNGSQKQYENWRLVNHASSLQTIILNFGSWEQAKELATQTR